MTESTPETTTGQAVLTFQVIEYRRDPSGAASSDASAEMTASDAIAHIERRRAFAFSDGLEVSPAVAAEDPTATPPGDGLSESPDGQPDGTPDTPAESEPQ